MTSVLKDKIIKITASLLILLLIFTVYPGDRRVYAAEKTDIDTVFTNTADSIYKSIKDDPDQDNIWSLYGLSIAGYPVKDSVLDKFKSNLDEYVKSKDGKLTISKRDRAGVIVETDTGQYTEYSKLVIILTELGMDPNDVAGYSMVDPLADYSRICKQGINGPIWALMALDSCGYSFSDSVKKEYGSDITTRSKLIGILLKTQLKDGGWAFMGDKADPDITGMTVRALAPHYNDSEEIKNALDKAVKRMSKMQLDTGDFATIMETGAAASPTSESASQIICAASLLGIDTNSDSRFVKEGKSAIDALLAYYDSKTCGFKHISQDKKVNGLATQQGFYALAHYYRYALHKYYDMSEENIARQEAKDKAKKEIIDGYTEEVIPSEDETEVTPSDEPASDAEQEGSGENGSSGSGETSNDDGKSSDKNDDNKEADNGSDKKDEGKKLVAGGATYGGGQAIKSDKIRTVTTTKKVKTEKKEEEKEESEETDKSDKNNEEKEDEELNEQNTDIEENTSEPAIQEQEVSESSPEQVQDEDSSFFSSRRNILAVVLGAWLVLGLIYLIRSRKRSS